jgi:hypothetical protein
MDIFLVVIAFISFLVIWWRYKKREMDWIKRDNEWWNEVRTKLNRGGIDGSE